MDFAMFREVSAFLDKRVDEGVREPVPRALHAAEAKQRVFNEAGSAVELAEALPEEPSAQAAAEVYFAVLRMLATEYQSHEDYRLEWWPEHEEE
ncbi:DUF6221 family protein [Amycolatopsis sp. NPDC059021]|uniref:DUF6221 family protein n=1 Tax=Amycolatopsis sp. NPDC059021 TaxID=3346704 RepID=UPI00366C37FA